MKEIEVTCSKWRNGQGWEYHNSVIDRIKVEDTDPNTAEDFLNEVKLNVEPNLAEEDSENGIDYEWTVNVINDEGDVIDTASAWETEFVN